MGELNSLSRRLVQFLSSLAAQNSEHRTLRLHMNSWYQSHSIKTFRMSRYLQANHETYQDNYKLLVSGNYFHNRFMKYFQAPTGFVYLPLGLCNLALLTILHVQTSSFVAFISFCRPRGQIYLS